MEVAFGWFDVETGETVIASCTFLVSLKGYYSSFGEENIAQKDNIVITSC